MARDHPVNEEYLETLLAELETAREWSPRVIAKLEHHLFAADDLEVFRMNPIQYAGENRIAEDECIDLFLHATKLQILDMYWQLVCPGCGGPIDSFTSLQKLNSHFYCGLCRVDGIANLDDYILVSFNVSSAVRPIRYHDPHTLPVADYILNYRFMREACVPKEHPAHEHFLRTFGVEPQVRNLFRKLALDMFYLEPGATKSISVEVPQSGYLVMHDFDNAGLHFLAVKPDAPTSEPVVELSGGKMTCPINEIPAGMLRLEFRNQNEERAAVLVFCEPESYVGAGMELAPFLSGKRLLNTPTYRNLFRSDITVGTEGLGVKDLTILFTDIKGSTELYDQIGDLNAFNLVQQHFGQLESVIQNHGGVVIKTIGDAVMATFLSPVDAVRAAIQLQEQLHGRTAGGAPGLQLKVGVHSGPSIAVTQNDRLDYFGQTVNIAARVEAMANATEICMTEDVFAVSSVPDLLRGFTVTTQMAHLKGVQNEMKVYRAALSR